MTILYILVFKVFLVSHVALASPGSIDHNIPRCNVSDLDLSDDGDDAAASALEQQDEEETGPPRAQPFIRHSYKVSCPFYSDRSRSPAAKIGSLQVFQGVEYFYSEWNAGAHGIQPFEFPPLLRGVEHPHLLKLYHDCNVRDITGSSPDGSRWRGHILGQLTQALPERFEHLSAHLFAGYDRPGDVSSHTKRLLFAKVFYGIFDTLEYMHNSPIGAIGHGDLKWQNIMLDPHSGEVKVMDTDTWFLLQSRFYKTKAPHTYCLGKPSKIKDLIRVPSPDGDNTILVYNSHHASPECIFPDSYVGVHSDIFAAGQLVVLALGGKPLTLR